MTNCEPPFPKELEHVLLQSFGGGGEVGGEDAALVMVTNASSIAMSLPKGWGGCRVCDVGLPLRLRCAVYCTVLMAGMRCLADGCHALELALSCWRTLASADRRAGS